MATNKETAAADEAAEVARKAREAEIREAVENGAEATEEARKQDAQTIKAQAEARPYPSQEEADAMKSAAAIGAAPYATRDMKP